MPPRFILWSINPLPEYVRFLRNENFLRELLRFITGLETGTEEPILRWITQFLGCDFSKATGIWNSIWGSCHGIKEKLIKEKKKRLHSYFFRYTEDFLEMELVFSFEISITMLYTKFAGSRKSLLERH